MEIWVFLSISAAIFQTLRFILQKFLSDTRLGVAGATFSRFIYSAPILLVLAPVWFGYFGYPIVTGSFLISSSIHSSAPKNGCLQVIPILPIAAALPNETAVILARNVEPTFKVLPL